MQPAKPHSPRPIRAFLKISDLRHREPPSAAWRSSAVQRDETKPKRFFLEKEAKTSIHKTDSGNTRTNYLINALRQKHYQTGTIRTQFRDITHPSSENHRPRTAKTGETPTKTRPRRPQSTRARAPSRTRPTEATAPASTRRPATARTPDTARTRTGPDPATTARSPNAAPAGHPPPTTASPARNRCTIAQSTAISPSNAQKIRQIETTRSQHPNSSAAPTTPPTAPRSALRLKLGGRAAVLFIRHSTPRHLAEQKTKIQH